MNRHSMHKRRYRHHHRNRPPLWYTLGFLLVLAMALNVPSLAYNTALADAAPQVIQPKHDPYRLMDMTVLGHDEVLQTVTLRFDDPTNRPAPGSTVAMEADADFRFSAQTCLAKMPVGNVLVIGCRVVSGQTFVIYAGTQHIVAAGYI